MKTLTKIVLKFGIAGLSIFAIGFLFLVSEPESEHLVQEAEADIFVTHQSDGKEMTRFMESIGVRPRPFDFNGNKMYFGTRKLNNTNAREAATMIQDELVAHGINSRNYIDDPTMYDRFRAAEATGDEQKIIDGGLSEPNLAMLRGELVPVRKTDEVIEMSGVTGLESFDAFGKKAEELHKQGVRTDLTDHVTGYRFIEVRAERESDSSEIIAVWTDDEGFDGKRMTNETTEGQSPADTVVPACIGCKRVRRLKPLNEDEPFVENEWESDANPQELYNFYVNAMQNRGWTLSGRQPLVDELSKYMPEIKKIKGRQLSMEKDGAIVNVTILPGMNGGSEVFSFERFEGAQPTLEMLPDRPTTFD